MKLKQLFLIGAGTILEIYDSYIVGFMLTTINRLFFPNALHNNFASVATFSILFLIRPISAFFWGILGDRLGKLLVFKHAILFMAIATIAIGLLPTYQQIGIFAPMLLLSLRALQGISISGEFGSAVVLCYEQSQPKQRFTYNGILYVFIFGGILIANAMTYFVYHTNINSNIAWRIPFIFGGACGFIIFFARQGLKLHEEQHHEVNIKLILKKYKLLCIVICAIFLINLNWLYFSFITTIFNNLLSHNQINQLSLQCSLIVLLSAFIFGKYIADNIKKSILLLLSIAIMTMYLLGFFLTTIMQHDLANAITIFYYLEAILTGIIFTSLPILIIDCLPTAIHNSIYNIANNISTAIIVGLMPFVVNLLIQHAQQNWIHYFFSINLAISFFSLIGIKYLAKKKKN